MHQSNTDPDKPRRPAISRERIVAAALGADPMAAYLHFENKAELLDAVVEHQAAKLLAVPPLAATDPIELMIGLARHYRSMLLEHPNLASLIASRPLPQSSAPESVASGVALLRLAGFEERDIPIAFDALVTFSFGFVLQEAEQAKRRERFGVPFDEQQQGLLRQLAEHPDDTTVAQAVIARRLEPGAAEEEFTTGIRALLQGLRAGLGRPPA